VELNTFLSNFLLQLRVSRKQHIIEEFVSFSGKLIYACSVLLVLFTTSLLLVWLLLQWVVRCVFSFVFSFAWGKLIAGTFKSVSEENVASGLYGDLHSWERLVDEGPSIWKTRFFWFKTAVAYRWCYVGGRSNIRHVQGFTGTSVGLHSNAILYQGSFFPHWILEALLRIVFGDIVIGGIRFVLSSVLVRQCKNTTADPKLTTRCS
jgi:hypothetical protein